MDTAIRKILVPVGLDEHSFCALKHAAELAVKNNSAIHLLHVIKQGPFNISRAAAVDALKLERMDMISHWKNWIEERYDLDIIPVIRVGTIRRQVLKYAGNEEMDFVLLGMNEQRSWRHQLFGNVAEQITQHSDVPVITIINNSSQAFKWKHVVVPVSNFIPEKRIRAILSYAMMHDIKIHFVALNEKTDKRADENFEILLDSLKLVKTFGNIPVECKNLQGSNLVNAAWSYACNIRANAIMVNTGRVFSPLKSL